MGRLSLLTTLNGGKEGGERAVVCTEVDSYGNPVDPTEALALLSDTEVLASLCDVNQPLLSQAHQDGATDPEELIGRKKMK